MRQTKPAAPAPIKGAMMNSHSCATAPGFEPMPTSAGPIERAGLSDARRERMDDAREPAIADDIGDQDRRNFSGSRPWRALVRRSD